MSERIQEIMKEAGTDSSGKWMSVDNANTFSQLVIQETIRWINENVGMVSKEAQEDLFEHFKFEKDRTNA